MTPVEAYNILLKRQINEDRILGERTSMFLLATTFLFLAFVTLLNPEWEGWIYTVLRIALPLLGIFLTFLLFSFNQSASLALTFWHKAQTRLEQIAPEFFYMRDENITPHVVQEDYMKGKKKWGKVKGIWTLIGVRRKKRHWLQKRLLHNQTVYRCFLPITFGALWVVALAVAIARIFS